MKLLIFKKLFFIFLITNSLNLFSMEKPGQSVWTPKTVIGTAFTLGSFKLIHDGLQKIFNPNRKFLSISNSTWFSGAQGGKYKTQNITITTPNTINAQNITIRLQRLSIQEENEELAQGCILLTFGAIGTLAGIYYLNS